MTILYRHYDVNRTDYVMGIKDIEHVATTKDYEKEINCICCERTVKFGDCYTSRRYYSASGLWGLWVCPECYKKEWEEQREYDKKMKEEEENEND